jgi:hypothetical protein
VNTVISPRLLKRGTLREEENKFSFGRKTRYTDLVGWFVECYLDTKNVYCFCYDLKHVQSVHFVL